MTYTSSAQNADALRIVFEHTPEPTREERKDLARDLGLTFEKVSRWFSRERSDAPRRLLADGTKLQAMKRPTLEQKSRLEAEYSLNPKPSVQRQKEIALDVGLTFYGIFNLLSVLPYYVKSALPLLHPAHVPPPPRIPPVSLQSHHPPKRCTFPCTGRSMTSSDLAIGFFVIIILTVFSTLLCIPPCRSRIATDVVCYRYFAERGTWDEVMDTFINSDGDPTQFASSPPQHGS
ncbi:hypothetical protein DFP72DRAFT_1140016 [Ephemerocybe angulata]|uniref:Homeobox domain-containing protein n=1 Tax=Ephemerocybe angulata TaxID=980116 RepID=A0A8H6HNT0_9AGAR|nr:hypothetical protein DFP72DRAFT_1140016 [Tulosesus angulatus]